MPGIERPSRRGRRATARAVPDGLLPWAFSRHPGADPLRAHAFFEARGRRDDLAAARERARGNRAAEMDAAARDQLRAERIGALARLSPDLIELAKDARPAVRGVVARCYSIMAVGGQAPADRRVWRMLLGLSRYDIDAEVRSAADDALARLERYGTVARAS